MKGKGWIVFALILLSISFSGRVLADEVMDQIDEMLEELQAPPEEPTGLLAPRPEEIRIRSSAVMADAKIQKAQQKFVKKSTKRRKRFFEKLKKKDLTNKELHQRLKKFQQKEKKLAENFYAKLHKKISQQQEPVKSDKGSLGWKRCFYPLKGITNWWTNLISSKLKRGAK